MQGQVDDGAGSSGGRPGGLRAFQESQPGALKLFTGKDTRCLAHALVLCGDRRKEQSLETSWLSYFVQVRGGSFVLKDVKR